MSFSDGRRVTRSSKRLSDSAKETPAKKSNLESDRPTEEQSDTDSASQSKSVETSSDYHSQQRKLSDATSQGTSFEHSELSYFTQHSRQSDNTSQYKSYEPSEAASSSQARRTSEITVQSGSFETSDVDSLSQQKQLSDTSMLEQREDKEMQHSSQDSASNASSDSPSQQTETPRRRRNTTPAGKFVEKFTKTTRKCDDPKRQNPDRITPAFKLPELNPNPQFPNQNAVHPLADIDPQAAVAALQNPGNEENGDLGNGESNTSQQAEEMANLRDQHRMSSSRRKCLIFSTALIGVATIGVFLYLAYRSEGSEVAETVQNATGASISKFAKNFRIDGEME